MLIVIILLKFVFNHPWLFIEEMVARYNLETLPYEKIRIDYETSMGNKTKKEIEIYKQKMQKNIDFFSPMDARLTIILIIYNIITVFLLCIIFILLITNIIGIFTINSKYMMSISIIGILLLLIIIIKTFCIYISVNRKLKEINKDFFEWEGKH
jgi:flagellar biosynthesis component FlhA